MNKLHKLNKKNTPLVGETKEGMGENSPPFSSNSSARGFCRFCGSRIPEYMYRSARFCSTKCRQAHWESSGSRKALKNDRVQLESVGNLPVVYGLPWKSGIKFWCDKCGKHHYHGFGEGHRVSHCPHREDYILKLRVDQ